MKRLQFWESEYSLTTLLVMLVVTLFIVTPLASSSIISSELLLCFLAAVTVTGVAAASEQRMLFYVVALLAPLSITLDWSAHLTHNPSLEISDLVLRIAFVLLLAFVVTLKVFRPGNVTHHRVQGAIVVYLLAGLAWAYTYEALAVLDNSAFHMAASYSEPVVRVGLFRYFSFVTLTTLGYGDILPISPLARALATSEALFGQLYPAVMITRLVSLEFFDRRPESK